MREAVLEGEVFRISLDPEALESLWLDDSEIEAAIEAPAEHVARLREVLAQVLACGRADVLPARVVL